MTWLTEEQEKKLKEFEKEETCIIKKGIEMILLNEKQEKQLKEIANSLTTSLNCNKIKLEINYNALMDNLEVSEIEKKKINRG